jgi:translation initiation factor 2B subunit (eIF-2B alpha/beta/delta family)
MLNKTQRILKDIKSLKVQGASNVAFACQDAFLFEVQNYKGKDILKDFTNLGKAFWKSRDTEPAMKHFISKFLVYLEKNLDDKKRKEKLVDWICEFKKQQVNDIYTLTHNVDKLPIHKKVVVFTHCHSSIVVKSILELHKLGKLDFVVNTETRPLFQGRKTSKDLIKKGILVYHIVDSAVYSYAKMLLKEGKKIIFFSGADVITKDFKLINKIGTSQISLALNSLGINHYVFTTLNKIDPLRTYNTLKDVEIRNAKEVWDERELKILTQNFAFDITEKEFISGIVTEKGILTLRNYNRFVKVNKEEKKYWDLFR